MKLFSVVITALAIGLLAGRAGAQALPSGGFGLEQGETDPLQVGVHVEGTHANAPPGQCGCFWATGAGLQVVRNFGYNLGAVLDVSFAAASNVDSEGDNLHLLNFTLGPRYTYRRLNRYIPYAQLLAGGSHVSSATNYYGRGTTAIALQAGGGLEYWISPHYTVPVEVDYVYSQIANNVNSRQSNYRVGVGVVYRFGFMH